MRLTLDIILTALLAASAFLTWREVYRRKLGL